MTRGVTVRISESVEVVARPRHTRPSARDSVSRPGVVVYTGPWAQAAPSEVAHPAPQDPSCFKHARCMPKHGPRTPKSPGPHRYAAPCTQPNTVPEPAEKRCGCALRGCAAALCAVASGRHSARTPTMLADAGNAVSDSWCGCAPAWVQWLPRQPSATASRRPERLWRRQASSYKSADI